MSKPLIAIVGRPNVGKSTLFNRLVGRRAAVVTDVPGTTRDRISLDTRWEGRPLIVVDTGGLEMEPDSPMSERVRSQVDAAIDAADGIIFLTDVTDGLTPVDLDIGDRLRRTKKPVTLAVNKADNRTLSQGAVEFYQLALGEPVPISAHHNVGVYQLMDLVLAGLPAPEEDEPGQVTPALAIVGRTNVGKSALLNAVLGEERTIVSDIPGTTRDAIDTPISFQGQDVLLIDTAGIRRRGRIEKGIERYSVMRAVQAIDRSDVAFLVLDASDLATAQDTHIAGQVVDAFKGAVIVVNKWDLAPELGRDQAECLAELRERFKFMPYAPIRFVSALEGIGVSEALDVALKVYEERQRWVPKASVSAAAWDAMAAHHPPSKGHRSLRVDRVVQEAVGPPTFAFYVNYPSLIHFSYHRYLENSLRDKLGFRWSHLKLVFKGGKER